jgi:hypothetical protein
MPISFSRLALAFQRFVGGSLILESRHDQLNRHQTFPLFFS